MLVGLKELVGLEELVLKELIGLEELVLKELVGLEVQGAGWAHLAGQRRLVARKVFVPGGTKGRVWWHQGQGGGIKGRVVASRAGCGGRVVAPRAG